MNDMTLERELRAWYAAEVDEGVVAPADLRLDVLAIPARHRRVQRLPLRRPTTLLVAAVVASAATLATALVGSSLLRTAPPSPPPSRPVIVEPPASPDATRVATPVPSPSVPDTLSPVLGGGPILASVPHPGERPCHTTAAPFDIVTVDPGTAATTVIGTTSSACDNRTFDAHWANDRTGVILLNRYAPEQLDLATVTPAGRAFPIVCCNLPSNVWQGGGGGGQNWMMSPRGDRVAAVHTAPSGRGDGIVVSDVEGRNATTLLLPKGADAYGFSWSPDESVITVTACTACGTSTERSHLYLVPVDGSAMRSLVDGNQPGEGIGFAAWAPDGRTIAAVLTTCVASDPAPCSIDHTAWSLVTIDVATGTIRHIAAGSDFGHSDVMLEDPTWSPDGSRILVAVGRVSVDSVETAAIDPDGGNLTNLGPGRPRRWSPDGHWILVSRGRVGTDLWIVQVAGGDARHLGQFLSADW